MKPSHAENKNMTLHISVFIALALLLSVSGCKKKVPPPPQTETETSQQEQQPPSRHYVRAHMLNMRKCPSTTCRITNVLKHGDSGIVIEEHKGWSKLHIPEKGITGWVSTSYIVPEAMWNQGQPPTKRAALKPKTAHKPAAGQKPDIQPPPIPVEELATP